MRIAVVGAGVVGCSTARELARSGHEVLLIERHAAPAQGASHANAGLVSPGHCFSWAEPGVGRAAMLALLGQEHGMGICQPWHPRLWRWAWLFAREASPRRWLRNSRAALALATFSRDVLLRTGHGLDMRHWSGRTNGIVYLQRSQTPPAAELDLLRAAGERCEVLTRTQTLEREPFLRHAPVAFGSAMVCPGDATGDAARFAVAALREVGGLGAEVRLGESVLGFGSARDAVRFVETDRGRHAVDAVVIAAGLQSRALFARLGYRLPIFPVSGYSITYHDVAELPAGGGVALADKIAWAGFDNGVLRFTGFADIGRPGARLAERRFRALERFAYGVQPALAGCPARRWVGQRPMTPDGLPFLGATRWRNVWANCGHGAMGWTMAHGCARVIAELVQGARPGLDLRPYSVERYALLRRRDIGIG